MQIPPDYGIFFPGDAIMSKKLYGSLALALATIIWGSTFIAQSVGMDHIGPMTFQAVRCFLAVLFLFPLTALVDRRDFWKKWLDPKLWKAGSICGIALAVAAGLQQVGLIYTPAGKAGFITAMYIVLVPFLGLFFHKRPPIAAWFSVALAVLGLYLLSGAGLTALNPGDLCLLGCALGFSVQITLIDQLSGDLDGIRLNCVQSLVCSLCSALVMLFTETPEMGSILDCWFPLGYAGILSMGVAYTLQIVGQRYVDPTPASLIMSAESVFAALCGWLLLNERMSGTELLGCGLVFGAVLLSQLPDKKKQEI